MNRTNPSDNETFTEVSLKKDSIKDYRSKDVNVAKKEQSRFSLFSKPVFNILISLFLSILLLLLFLHADGKLLDYTIIQMKIPSLISLILIINLIFIASGISTAISEYKWVQLQNGCLLTLIDIYDGCTRGLSGFFTTFISLHFDFVLIIAFLFHLGLLFASPVSQAILVPSTENYNRTGIDTRLYYYRATFLTTRSALASSRQPPLMNGLARNSYLTASSFAQASIGSKPIPTFSCPEQATQCIFPNVTYISTSMSCKNMTGKGTAIANHNEGTQRTVIVLDEYFTARNISDAKFKFPKFLYSTEMYGRTYYDLANYTQPLMPGLNIPLTQASNVEYDPQYRSYVGDQIFVMAYKTKDPAAHTTITNFTELSYKKCWLTSSLNTSTWKTLNGTLVQDSIQSSTPIHFDYDSILGNNTGIDNDNPTTKAMINAYIMQQAILYELTTPKYYTMTDYMRTFSFSKVLLYNNTNLFELFMKEALASFDYAFFQSPSVSATHQDIITLPSEGMAYFILPARYKVQTLYCYLLCFGLILPVLWWLMVWTVSLKKNDSVSRASSQIILLSTGLTSLAEQQLIEISNLDNRTAFEKAQNISVRLGRSKDHIVVFGLNHEQDLKPLV